MKADVLFVQISDENLHHVRELMDEVFGKENFVSIISFVKTTAKGAIYLDSINDYVIWYAEDVANMKYHQMYIDKELGGERMNSYIWIESPDGSERKKLTSKEIEDKSIPSGWLLFSLQNMTSQSGGENSRFPVSFGGKEFIPKKNFWKTNPSGMQNLIKANRIMVSGANLNYVRYRDDFPLLPITNVWNDTAIAGFSGEEKVYVVQTAIKVIQRCILMTTGPGDLVFDPTCGSGTTAYVAEQWGRRWITCDTSRVALTLARQRLMTAVFPYYKLADEKMGLKGGFIYEEVPHITLKSIAQNEPHDKETLFDKPEIDKKRVRVAGPFTVEGIPQLYGSDDFTDVNYEAETAVIARSEATKQSQLDAVNHINTLIELLRKDGVTFPGNKRMKFENFIPVSGGFIHAEGEPIEKNGLKKVAVSFGPPHGPVTLRQVEDGIREAHINGYDGIIFCGFAFDSSAMDVKHPKVKVFYSHIRPDVLVGDLLKTTASSQLFTVFGEPDIEIKKKKDEYEVILKGVDIYDPLTGEVYSDNGDRIAAWFIDADYDKRAFCISQAFFPDSNAWDKLKRALKASIDEDKFELLTSTCSLPFKLGKEKRIAVKVIDHRGNEVMVVRKMK